jgi:hypothetical protein
MVDSRRVSHCSCQRLIAVVAVWRLDAFTGAAYPPEKSANWPPR